MFLLSTVAAFAALQTPSHSTCLAFVSENLAKGNGNWYTYFKISDKPITFKAGDKLEYDIYLDPKDPAPKGGVDIEFSDGSTALRDAGATDQNGITAHGDGLLTPAIGKWYHREIPLDVVAGKMSSEWDLVFEGDEPGVYVQFVDNIDVVHANGFTDAVYEGGIPPFRQVATANGYTKYPACEPVDRSLVGKPDSLRPVIAGVVQRAEKLRSIRTIQDDADALAALLPNDVHVKNAKTVLQGLETTPNLSAAKVRAATEKARAELLVAKPELAGYMGFLVGYAHIDLQWLWEWQEAMVASRDTFRQAIRFMDEIPDFRFSQSSSAHYKAIEDNYPELFAKIKEKVASGQIEIVGGRVCEADTNVIGPESHARQFLYGQRYFRERFGKTAVVGWEPDTFGHTLQMPQILKLGGCRYYYFCRGGKGQPLFWWKGLDGTKVLAFDDTAAGSWYNSNLDDHQFQEMANVEKKAGSKSIMAVYGVGNHGGGPTREELQEAIRWKETGYLPETRFSTAHTFFTSLDPSVLRKAPTIDQELNPVFEGCYTTHSAIKQAMRNAETWTLSAEAVSTVASLKGFHYPKTSLRHNWEVICTNQHHDTMGGSGVHSPYEKTQMRLEKVVADDHEVIADAMESLVQRVTPKKGGLDVLVFNPTGWTRSAWCETYLVQSGWNSGVALDPAKAVAYTPDGRPSAVEVEDAPSRKARFWAADVPAYGYKVFHIANGSLDRPELKISNDGYTVENERFIIEFDKNKGVIKRLVDKQANRTIQGGGLGRLEAHFELPGGMSAWTLGKVDQIEALSPQASDAHNTPYAAEVVFYYQFPSVNNPKHDSIVKQTFRLESGSDQITCDVDCDWNQIGSSKTTNPDLRVAFEPDFSNPIATYEIPFGALARPLDGQECATQKWMDIATDGYGISIFNDSKYGASATGSTIRLTLIRSSFDPDPVPDDGHHHWRYAIYPHSGDWKSAGTVRKAAEFNQPLFDETVPFDARGKDPLEWGLLSVSQPDVIPTALKRAEDGDGVVLRVYEAAGEKSEGQIKVNSRFAGARWVNFVEDPVGAATLAGNEVPLNLHGFEIRTVKLLSTRPPLIRQKGGPSGGTRQEAQQRRSGRA